MHADATARAVIDDNAQKRAVVDDNAQKRAVVDDNAQTDAADVLDNTKISKKQPQVSS